MFPAQKAKLDTLRYLGIYGQLVGPVAVTLNEKAQALAGMSKLRNLFLKDARKTSKLKPRPSENYAVMPCGEVNMDRRVTCLMGERTKNEKP